MSWDVVAELLQGGLVARRDLRDAGVTSRWIRREVDAKRLVVKHPGVLALPELPEELVTDFNAALLFAGPDAALSHTSALEVYGLLENFEHQVVHVAVPRGGARSCDGVRVHQGWREPFRVVDGLRVVGVRQAIVGAATVMPASWLRFPAMQAVQQKLLIAAELADPHGVPPTARARMRLIGEEALAGAESGGEATYYRMLLDSHLPTPQLQVWVTTVDGEKRLDVYWHRLRLGCEIDGERYHGPKPARERDRNRRNAVQAEAVKLFDFSVEQIMSQQAHVLELTEANLLARAHELRIRPWW